MSAIKNDKTGESTKTELPMTPDKGFQPFNNVTKNYIKDAPCVLDPPL